MKYFNNITTPEELKKQFRALSIKLHPDRGGNAEEFRNMMAEYMAISKDFDRAKELEEANEHTAAVMAQLYVLSAVGLRVRPFIVQLKAIEQAHRKRGYILPEEVEKRAQIRKEAERRAALFLTPYEFRALYGHEPEPDRKAA